MMDSTSATGTDPTTESASFAIPAVPPFHLEATVRVLQRRPTNRVNLWDGGRYLRVLPTAEGLRLIAVGNHGTIDAPDLPGPGCGGPGRVQQRTFGLAAR